MKIYAFVLLIAALVIFGGCKKDNPVSHQTNKLSVVSRSPLTDIIKVSDSITVTFSSILIPSTAKAELLSQNGSSVHCRISVSSDKLIIKPDILKYSWKYYLTIPKSISSEIGTTMENDYKLTLFTAPAIDTTKPRVTSYYPATGELFPYTGGVIKITFSEPVTTVSLIVKDDNGNVVNGNVSTVSNVVSFAASSKLSYESSYTYTITASDTVGNSLATPFIANFKTEALVFGLDVGYKISGVGTDGINVYLTGQVDAGYDFFIAKLNEKGEKVWLTKNPTNASYGRGGSIIISNNYIFVSRHEDINSYNPDIYLDCYDINTGIFQWTVFIAKGGISELILNNNSIFTSSGYTVFKISLSGVIVKKYNASVEAYDLVLVSDGLLLVGVPGSHHGAVEKVDANLTSQWLYINPYSSAMAMFRGGYSSNSIIYLAELRGDILDNSLSAWISQYKVTSSGLEYVGSSELVAFRKSPIYGFCLNGSWIIASSTASNIFRSYGLSGESLNWSASGELWQTIMYKGNLLVATQNNYCKRYNFLTGERM